VRLFLYHCADVHRQDVDKYVARDADVFLAPTHLGTPLRCPSRPASAGTRRCTGRARAATSTLSRCCASLMPPSTYRRRAVGTRPSTGPCLRAISTSRSTWCTSATPTRSCPTKKGPPRCTPPAGTRRPVSGGGVRARLMYGIPQLFCPSPQSGHCRRGQLAALDSRHRCQRRRRLRRAPPPRRRPSWVRAVHPLVKGTCTFASSCICHARSGLVGVCPRSDVAVTEALLKSGAVDVNAATVTFATALHDAAVEANPEITKLLLQVGRRAK